MFRTCQMVIGGVMIEGSRVRIPAPETCSIIFPHKFAAKTGLWKDQKWANLSYKREERKFVG